MLKLTRVLTQSTKSTASFHNFLRVNYSPVTTVELKPTALEDRRITGDTKNSNKIEGKSTRNNMVAAAFAQLHKDRQSNISTPETDKLVASANTVNDLLSISKGDAVSRKHALKVISILADWSLKGKVQLTDFETDPRYIKLCKTISKPAIKYSRNYVHHDDLSTVLTVTADDEAAKLVATISLPQMVKVMTTLTLKKRRSILLLRALSFNITRSTETLDLKQSSDILYSMAILNFPDENLLQKVCSDAAKVINDNLQKSPVLGSVLTSLGLLRYKDNDILDASAQWIMRHTSICRPQDIFTFFLTMAVLNFEPPNADELFKKLIPELNIANAIKPSAWLDVIWSLVLLNRATTELINTVLATEFIDSITKENGQSIPSKLKMINVDAAAENLILNYSGPRLEASSSIRSIEILRSKDKEDLSSSIIECLKNLVSDKHLRLKINTNMGFYIDAECHFDNKCNPILPDKFENLPNQRKVAILGFDYHDMCKGNGGPTGINVLAIRLLEAKGYRVLTVPYNEYRPRDKLVDRVQYLESKLKHIVL